MEEKIKMYKEKKAFIDGLSKVFETKPAGSAVDSIKYEVYTKEIARDENIYRHCVEFVIITFVGGGKSVKVVSGNSNTANFRVLGPMLDGGYYEENSYYDSMVETGYEAIDLSDNKVTLDDLLKKPMTHISDVHACLNNCKKGKDVVRVLERIPSMFGTFTVEFNADGETFLVTNSYDEDGSIQYEETEFEFCAEED
jgi:hypothetical protein